MEPANKGYEKSKMNTAASEAHKPSLPKASYPATTISNTTSARSRDPSTRS
jgi:hypothetical protein